MSVSISNGRPAGLHEHRCTGDDVHLVWNATGGFEVALQE